MKELTVALSELNITLKESFEDISCFDTGAQVRYRCSKCKRGMCTKIVGFKDKDKSKEEPICYPCFKVIKTIRKQEKAKKNMF